MRRRASAISLWLVGAIVLAGCGFRPIYATPEGASAPVNRQIAIGNVAAPEEIHLFVVDALRERIVIGPEEEPLYSLDVIARERAQRLAVQIDATVTRYNYRLGGRYTLRDLRTGATIRGTSSAVTSYNIVSSQYSTLFAERTAREKAARLLAENIERDIILRLADFEAGRADPDEEPSEEPLFMEDFEDRADPFGGDAQPFIIDETEQ